MEEEKKDEINPREFFLKDIENPNLNDLQEHLQDLFTVGEDNAKMTESFETKIKSKVIQDLICWLAWDRRGRIEGVHPDFGKLSYLRSKKLSSNYHCSDEGRIEMILDLTERMGRL
jgi:hypothetical protein